MVLLYPASARLAWNFQTRQVKAVALFHRVGTRYLARWCLLDLSLNTEPLSLTIAYSTVFQSGILYEFRFNLLLHIYI
jgi:hypothetical protein